MRFFLINFLVTLIAYGLISFVYPSEGTGLPRIWLVWGSPLLGTLVAWWVTKVLFPGRALGAHALAIYTVSGVYCLVYQQKAILDTCNTSRPRTLHQERSWPCWVGFFANV
jgi:hypothetical protein